MILSKLEHRESLNNTTNIEESFTIYFEALQNCEEINLAKFLEMLRCSSMGFWENLGSLLGILSLVNTFAGGTGCVNGNFGRITPNTSPSTLSRRKISIRNSTTSSVRIHMAFCARVPSATLPLKVPTFPKCSPISCSR